MTHLRSRDVWLRRPLMQSGLLGHRSGPVVCEAAGGGLLLIRSMDVVRSVTKGGERLWLAAKDDVLAEVSIAETV